MKVKQISEILNDIITGESLGINEISEENLENIVSIAGTINEKLGVDNYIKALTNRIGKVVFVNRSYKAKAPDVLMDGWTYGSILQKIDADMPETTTNESWGIGNGEGQHGLVEGRTYDQDIFTGAIGVRQRFFNGKTTYEIDISIPWVQVEESFGSLEQLNAFFDMIYVKINNKMELNTRNLTMRTINNFIAAKLYYAFSKSTPQDTENSLSRQIETAVANGTELSTIIGNNTEVSAINLLGMYKESRPDDASIQALDAESCITDLGFIKFASYQIALFSDRVSDISTLFNMGERERFTPKDRQHLVLLSEFAKAADVFLQSDTFHEEFTKLPKSETVIYWQGSGKDYSFSSTSKISVANRNFVKVVNGEPTDMPEIKKIQMTGVIGCLFDNDALGICNMKQRVHNHENKKGEFTNLFYKNDAQYFNDYHENFIVFFVA